MNFKLVVFVFSLALNDVTIQSNSLTQNYNVVSPAPNALYAAGQILPCTVDLSGNSTNNLNLTISLVSVSPGSNIILTISTYFIVSKTESSAKVENNVTYYEKSMDYQIPESVVTGLYNVVFIDKITNTEVNIPVNILGKASNSTSSTVSNNPSATSPPSFHFSK